MRSFPLFRHFGKQDTLSRVLLAFFIFALPFSALLAHGRILLCLALLSFFFLHRREFLGALRSLRKHEIFFLFYLATVLGGCCKPSAFLPSAAAAILALAVFLPRFSCFSRAAVCRALAFSGAICGLAALALFCLGRSPTLWTDTARFGTLARAAVFFGNPNLLGAFLSPALFCAAEEVRLHRKTGGWAIYTLCAALCTAGLLLTYSRGAWVGTFCGGLLYAVGLWQRKPQMKAYALPPFLLRALSVFSPDSSVGYRFSLWKSIFRLPAAALFFGLGEGRAALLGALSPYMAAGLEAVEHTHSLFLHLLCAQGILGMLFFLLFLIFRPRTGEKDYTVAFRAAFFTLPIYGIFDDPLYSGQIGVLFWMLSNVN